MMGQMVDFEEGEALTLEEVEEEDILAEVEVVGHIQVAEVEAVRIILALIRSILPE